MTADVLLVDDSATVRADLQDAFEHESFSVSTAATAAAAVDALMSGSFHLILLDVVLPDGDGLELLRRIRANPQTASLPVMLLSTEAEVAARIRGLQVGADEYVGKPYDRGYVVDRARQLIAASRGRADTSSRPVVLLAEPDPAYRAALAEALEHDGYSVVLADSGPEALRRAASLRPHVVVVNSGALDLDGAAVIQQIRLDPALRRTACLLVLDSYEAGAELRALSAGADASIRKDEDFGLVLARLRAVNRAAQTVGALPPTPGVMGPKKVLVVDADAGSMRALADELRQEGYDVVVAATGRDALEMLSAQVVDCMVLELELPDWSGLELMKVIRRAARWRDTPIIVRTARESDTVVIDAVGAGADDYLPKASGVQLLRARLRAVLRRKQIEDEDRRYRDALIRTEAEAAEARLRAELAEMRTALLEDVKRKNEELERTNAALAAAKEHAEQESQFKSRFLAIMSHELRTPLNAILGFAQLLERRVGGELTDKQGGQVLAVVRNSRQLMNLVNDILDLSKIQAGRMTLRRESLDVAHEVQTAGQTASGLAAAQGIGLHVDVPPGLPTLQADPFRLQQILGNLLTNAIKFTPRGGTVRARARADAGGVVLAVEDTGIGISQEDLPRLFKEFERLESSRTHRAEGTGLGLALTKHLVELHGGHIEVESQSGVGSVFSVWLPAAGHGAPAVAPHAAARSSG